MRIIIVPCNFTPSSFKPKKRCPTSLNKLGILTQKLLVISSQNCSCELNSQFLWHLFLCTFLFEKSKICTCKICLNYFNIRWTLTFIKLIFRIVSDWRGLPHKERHLRLSQTSRMDIFPRKVCTIPCYWFLQDVPMILFKGVLSP